MLGRARAALFPTQRHALPLSRCRLSTSAFRLSPASSKLLALNELIDDEHHALARQWLDDFVPEDVPKESYQVSYARSSGPGGQHVNKTNSKAVVRFDLHRAKGVWLPPFVVPALQKSVSESGRGVCVPAQTIDGPRHPTGGGFWCVESA